MESLIPRCAFLDVHKQAIEACVRRLEPDGRLHQETRLLGNDDAGPVGHGRLDDSTRRHPGGDEVDRGLLETDLQHPGKSFSGAAGQRAASEAGAGTEK